MKEKENSTEDISSVEADKIRNEVKKINWWHRIDLGDGIITPGKADTMKKLELIGLPNDLTGKTVLDIGAWDGFYSFQAEKRNAKRVLATDSVAWDKNQWNLKNGFNFAKKILNSNIEEKEIDVMELSPEKIGTFDVVLFLGVLYHLKHPLLALEKVASVTKGMVIVETFLDMVDQNRPACAFYPGRELNDEPSNWFGPNALAVEAMLKTVGFSKVKLHFQNSVHYRVDFQEKVVGKNDEHALPASRATFHAWK